MTTFIDKTLENSVAVFVLHPETRLGPVHLTVSDLQRCVRFYTDTLGLRLLSRQADEASLGTNGRTPLLVLAGRPGARPRPPRTTGLYHVAILLPTRADLARSLRHLAEVSYPLQGAADHGVSEALYLADPEGNGLEIYADRPRDQWTRRDGQLQMGTDPLDAASLLAEAPAAHQWEGLPAQTRIGHVHLQVADLHQAEAFYRELLGFDLIQRYGGSALFLSAGGYHHHLGLNTWAGAGAPPPPPDAVGLRYFTLLLPNQEELRRVGERIQAAGIPTSQGEGGLLLKDPSGNGVLLAAGNGV